VALKRKKTEKTHIRVLKTARDFATRQIEDDVADELSKTGVVWSGILDLEEPIPSTEVAAMLCAHELIKATRLIDAEPHWTDAAAFAAIGASCEVLETQMQDSLDSDPANDEESQSPIGFSPGHLTSPKN
jgi:hypothetical protein